MNARFLRSLCRGLACLAIQMLVASSVMAQVVRVSVATDSTQANGPSGNPSISANARFVVFTSSATNLTPEATAGTFVRDRQLGQTILIPNSLATGWPSISADGRYVLYEAANGWTVLDQQTSELKLITPVGGAPNVQNRVLVPRLSADGRHVAFLSDVRPPSPGDVLGVFVVNLDSGAVCSAHRASDGTPGDLPLGTVFEVSDRQPSVSDDGRFVVYLSRAANLVASDTNQRDDAFLHDCATDSTQRVSLLPGGSQISGGTRSAALSGDGDVVLFSTFELGPILPPSSELFLHHVKSNNTTFLGSTLGAISFPFVALNQDGTAAAYAPSGPSFVSSAYLRDLTETLPLKAFVQEVIHLGLGPVAIDEDGWVMAFQSAAGNLVPADTNAATDVFIFDRDLDRDGMMEDWEEFFDLNPVDESDGAQDPDGDGSTNAQEYVAQTHPKNIPSATRYFAEGANLGNFFSTQLYLANPAPTTARVLVRYLHRDGSILSERLELAGHRERAAQVYQGGEFSLVIESDATIVADRQMQWPFGNPYGSHAETGIASPSPTWYLAEGSTVGSFDLFYLLQNPGTLPSEVRVTYLLPTGLPIERTYAVPPSSRFTIWVDQIPELASTDVSAAIEVLSGPAIIVERSMYSSTPSRLFNAGHDGAGATTPAIEWTLAEGATSNFFDLFVLVANPNPIPAEIEASYLLVDGRVLQKSYVIPARSRFTIWGDEEEFAGVKELANVGVSTVIRSTPGAPVVVERAMWWPGSASEWEEAHVSLGATSTARRWGTGYVRPDPFGYDSFVLIANRSEVSGQVRVTFLRQLEEPIVQTYSLLPTSRFSIWLQRALPNAVGNFSVLVEAVDPLDLVVERSNYFDYGYGVDSIRWAGGDNALATPLP